MMRLYVLISVFLAIGIAAIPVTALFIIGFPVPMAAQTNFTAPAPSMQQDDIWSQTFYFPDSPVTAIALRPGTFGRRSRGVVTAWIGPELETGGNKRSGREFTIDISALDDSRVQVFHFPAVQYEPGTRGILLLTGTEIPSHDIFTLWQNTQNIYSDGRFTVNGHHQPGDLYFKILTPIRGFDIFRMIKSRWQSGLPSIWANFAWPVLPAMLWPIALAVALAFLLKQNERKQAIL
jgi:hypothetical protein